MRRWFNCRISKFLFFVLIILTGGIPSTVFAQTTTVRTSQELQSLLSQNKNFGVIR